MSLTREQVVEWAVQAGYSAAIGKEGAEHYPEAFAAWLEKQKCFAELAYAAGRAAGLGEAVEVCLPYLEDGESFGDEAKELAPMVRAALAAHRKEIA